MNTPSATPFRLQRPGMALTLLGCLFLFSLIVAGVLISFLPHLMPGKPEAILRISAVIQDMFVFIVPAIGMAMVMTRLPAQLLAVDRFPTLKTAILALGVLIVSIPAMNCIIEWNQSLHLPQSMAAVEEYFRALEQNATDATNMLIANSSIPALLVAILIVGVLAGFSEELFFRGAFQRVLSMMHMNHHVAIWTAAIVFSAFHFQIFGFVPRMLLGAFFGYTLYWTGSLWLPIILHIFNNSLVVIAAYHKPAGEGVANGIDTFGGSLSSPIEIASVILSILMVTAGIYLLSKERRFSTAGSK